MLRVRRALVSVWDKKGLVDFAKKLAQFQIEIISTGKTASLLKRSGIPSQEVSSLTSFPEILSGRVKTLHPKIFGGILANKKHPLHMEEIRSLGMPPFDMVVVNLYPFADKLREGLGWDEMMEYIDIGGVSLLRAGAKNYKNVACISTPSQYKFVLEELEKNKGFLPEPALKKLAIDVFLLTKEYDNSIYNYFRRKKILSWDLERVAPLRYGENPHQQAGLYRLVSKPSVAYSQIQGKDFSFNNFLDIDAAFRCVREFNEPAAAIVKHASLCGVGVDRKLAGAYRKAVAVDPISSFGGIISFNRKVDKETATQVLKSGFKECVIAPFYSKEALKIFSSKKNLRVVEIDFLYKPDTLDIRATSFGYLIQEQDIGTLEKGKLKVVTKRKPTQRELKDLLLGWKVVKHTKSNAIVVIKNSSVLGIAGGRPSRVGAVKDACNAAIKSSQGAVLASDGFFPKEDSIKLAHRKGIKAVIQPGGSLKDREIIACCNRCNIAMVFTGIRHFRH
ncbi:MAG: bifunctional phosphoribosylaminoimidazolecarboxamide formyltransferase/IMP cyclohydrolase [Candidatus Omnitrophota bacterium]|nr:MAG: bifunctional phosphoribosylaminoimidazolecarboxamide formyltransferase/IMP cyclohydrolase [Candidatus Omnitrophota bacterium]